ncbi:MAG: Piwi domain-containing protein [Planctomycetota bacterium]|jgi:hypothetical protein
MADNRIISSEFFPVQTGKLPRLYGYRIIAGDGNTNAIGGKLSYRLRKSFPGRWVWSTWKLISDASKSESEFGRVLTSLWENEPDTFAHLHRIVPIEGWRPTPKEIADFVHRGILSELSYKIRKQLRESQVDLGNAYVERTYVMRGWSVQGEPSVSISISSNLIYKQDLAAYTQTIPDQDELIGIWVLVKAQNFKGRIVDVVGTVKEHRARLLATSRSEEMQEIISAASDDELVVKIQARQSQYDYVASALNVILLMDYLSRFGIDSRKAMNAFRLAPSTRNQILTDVSKVLKKDGLRPYNSGDNPHLFLSASDVGFSPQLRFGGDQVCSANPRSLMSNLLRYGVYRRNERFDNAPIRIGIVDARETSERTTLAKNIQDTLGKMRFQVKFVGNQRPARLSREEIEQAVNVLQAENPDILIALLPDSAGKDYSEDNWAYGMLKSLTLGQDIQSQVIYESTLRNEYAVGNIVLGILGKTGNIPFVLAKPLPYADLVVGIDVAREKKKKLAGSINATAIARVYFNDGDFLRYTIYDAPIEGETIPDVVLRRLFPMEQFRDKRVVIHRDGYFRGNEKRALKEWAEKIGAEFFLVEIIKTGAPRLYLEVNNQIKQPPKGTTFKISEREALLVSSLPPFSNATPQPLHILCDESIGIESALNSVLSLTLLHYGSLRQPKLPVTVHYSDKIGYLALRGIKPKTLEGNIPFWL